MANFNAYNGDGLFINANQQTSIVPGFPSVSRRGTTATPFPTLNIAAFTGYSATAAASRIRGVLYIRDLFCNGAVAVPGQLSPSSNLFDQSQMDFRLAPRVAAGVPRFVPIPLTPSTANPFIDSGYGLPLTPATPLVMSNGLTLVYPPGYIELGPTAADQQTWMFSCLDEDAEGSANPRIHDHPMIPNSSYGLPIDIGFDEAADLAFSGMRTMTTRFVGGNIGQGVTADNTYLYYIGYTASIPAPRSALPSYRGYSHLPPPPNYNSVYDGSGGFRSWVAGAPSSVYYAPRVVDITPHLLPDLHRW